MTSDVATIPRYLELLWERDTRVRRGPKPGVAIRDIGAAGVRIADELGLEAVSMKAVGAALGMTTMSLYRYVDSKDELLTVMLDEAYGRPSLRWDEADGWRVRADRWARELAAALIRHPWVVSVPMHQAPMTPYVLSWTEVGVRAFDSSTLTSQEKMSSLLVLDGFVRNHVRQSLQLGAVGSDGSPSPDDGSYEAAIEAVVDEARYPALLAAAREMRDVTGAFYDDELDFGLGVLLDGLAARIGRS